ncbi:MAG: endonuclease/exonuclease/phosphatase family protein [Proteobacteria bacterium]|nr:endonuclease/exonuclease/phosphatase family protein [Pseudomonadota bacterium]
MRRLISLLCLIALTGCACTHQDPETPESPGQTGTPEPQPKRVRIATWNVHNLFDTVCDSESGCGGSNYEPTVTQTYYQSKVSNVMKGIWTIDADVVMLQEIEKESCLVDVQNSLGTQYYPSLAFGEMGNPAGLDVAILTRGEIQNVLTYRDQYWIDQPDGSQKRLARELLGAEIVLPNGVELTAFTTHFVSKATDPEGGRRLGEAKLTRQLLDEYIAAHPDRMVIFGGDLNDTPDSEQILTLSSDPTLANVTEGMPPEQITTWNDSVTFDYLFYTKTHAEKLDKAEVICDENRAKGFSSSDHCAVKATYYW